MKRRHDCAGYAMLAALVVMTLASAFALAAVGAVAGRSAVERSDARGWRADAASAEALDAVGASLRWNPAELFGSESGGEPDAEGVGGDVPWRAEWQPAPALADGVWPRVSALAVTEADPLGRRVSATLELQAEPWAAGVACSGDVVVDAPLLVAGSGVYVGGSLYGRENVGFVQGAGPAAPTGIPVDEVHGEAYPDAAVHAGADIYSHGDEIHDAAHECLWPLDTDRHVPAAPVSPFVEQPRADFVAAAADHGFDPGAAWRDGRLWLEALELPAGTAPEGAGGVCILTPRAEVTEIVGESSSRSAARVLLVVPGNAVVGAGGETTTLYGSLVVCGNLRVEGELRVTGAVWAQRLSIHAPVRVTVPPGWREHPLCGACRPVITEVG